MTMETRVIASERPMAEKLLVNLRVQFEKLKKIYEAICDDLGQKLDNKLLDIFKENWVQAERRLLRGESDVFLELKRLTQAVREAMAAIGIGLGASTVIQLGFFLAGISSLVAFGEAAAQGTDDNHDGNPWLDNIAASTDPNHTRYNPAHMHELSATEAAQMHAAFAPTGPDAGHDMGDISPSSYEINAATYDCPFTATNEMGKQVQGTIKCRVNYDSEGNATLTFDQPNWQALGITGKAVLVAPIGAHDVATGQQLLLVIGDPQDLSVDLTSILCSANPFTGVGFVSSPTENIACHDADSEPRLAHVNGPDGQKYMVTVDPVGGNVLLFSTKDGGQTFQVGHSPHTAQSLLDALKKRLKNVSLVKTQIILEPVWFPRAPAPQATAAPPQPTPTPIPYLKSDAAAMSATEARGGEPRDVLGTELSGQLNCPETRRPTDCPNVYSIASNSPELLELLKLLEEGRYFSEAGETVNRILSAGQEPNFIAKWLNNLFSKNTSSSSVNKIDVHGKTMAIDTVLALSIYDGKGTLLVERNGAYYLISGSTKNLQHSLTFKLKDASSQIDEQGTLVVQEVLKDAHKPTPSNLENLSTALWVTSPELVTGKDLGRNVKFKAEAKQGSVQGFESTPQGLIPTEINLGDSGDWSGQYYRDPKTGITYIGIMLKDKAGVYRRTVFVPVHSVNTGKE